MYKSTPLALNNHLFFSEVFLIVIGLTLYILGSFPTVISTRSLLLIASSIFFLLIPTPHIPLAQPNVFQAYHQAS